MNRFDAEAIIRLLVNGRHPGHRDILLRDTNAWAFVSLDELLSAFDHSPLRLDESATEPATVEGVTQIWSDGTDLKAKFGDGTVKTFTLT